MGFPYDCACLECNSLVYGTQYCPFGLAPWAGIAFVLLGLLLIMILDELGKEPKPENACKKKVKK